MLDTAACAPLTRAEQQQYAHLKTADTQRCMPEAVKVRAAYVAAHAAALAQRTGMTMAEASAIVEQQCRGMLLPDVVLIFTDKELAGCTVGDVLDDPGRFKGRTLADPIEGLAYGRNKAMVMVDGNGMPWIKSFAHGGGKYALEREPLPDWLKNWQGQLHDDDDNENTETEAEADDGGGESWVRTLVLDPADPMRSARAIIATIYTDGDGLLTLHRHRGTFWQYAGSHYRLADDETLRAHIWETLEAAFTDNRKPFKPTRSRVGDVLDALCAVTQLDRYIDPPAWLAGHPAPPANELFACANGLLHVPTGVLHPPTPSYFGLTASKVTYAPGAPVPELWLKFLDEALGDVTAMAAAQEWCGYVLVPDTSQQKILLGIGEPRSGKGTFARVLTQLLGSASVASPTMAHLSQPFGLETLITASLAIISDARVGQRTDQSAIVERLLSISGEDRLDVNRKYVKAWIGKLLARLVIMTNELPALTEGSGALAKRYIVLRFPNSYYGKEDTLLTDRLVMELSGILNWAIEGYRRLQKRGHFIQPANAVEMIEQIEMLGAPVKAFIRDECELGPNLQVTVDALYAAWVGWCKQGNRNPSNPEWFGRNLRAAAPGVRRLKARSTDGRVPYYQGIALVDGM
jgi:putative DNA primase/helicase